MSVLAECQVILGDNDTDDSHAAEIKRKAHAKIEALASFAKSVCKLAASDNDGDPVRALQLIANTNKLINGIDGVHRLLRQADPDTDAVLKQMAEVKKGPYRNLAVDVDNQLNYTEPVSWAVVPALRVIVQTLSDLEDISSA